mmetsp:Transcript_23940/g.33596  ORF Transcript_23940/g.33596 Transcript_23940/m.33596 type:complete len:90 (-) Transcript_23940:864-1133(-)
MSVRRVCRDGKYTYISSTPPKTHHSEDDISIEVNDGCNKIDKTYRSLDQNKLSPVFCHLICLPVSMRFFARYESGEVYLPERSLIEKRG